MCGLGFSVAASQAKEDLSLQLFFVLYLAGHCSFNSYFHLSWESYGEFVISNACCLVLF